MDRSVFFAKVREAPFGGSMTQGQVDGLNHILDEWDRRKLTDVRWLANMLAQSYLETARLMQPISEMGGETYLKSKPYYPFYGRGLIQITWSHNYKTFGIKNPDDALSWPVALRVLFDGMINGSFTGHKLSEYFSARVDDPVGARRIVNGSDKADIIAGYHRDFLAAISAAAVASPPPKPASPAPIPTALGPRPSFWAALWQAIAAVFRNHQG